MLKIDWKSPKKLRIIWTLPFKPSCKLQSIITYKQFSSVFHWAIPDLNIPIMGNILLKLVTVSFRFWGWWVFIGFCTACFQPKLSRFQPSLSLWERAQNTDKTRTFGWPPSPSPPQQGHILELERPPKGSLRFCVPKLTFTSPWAAIRSKIGRMLEKHLFLTYLICPSFIEVWSVLDRWNSNILVTTKVDSLLVTLSKYGSRSLIVN